ncbi:MAG TPA: hypothetical protein VD833_25380 [Vicinamibacterales bacterium]|nr:hypothetical protein [Vicinamibacterales bacterium]
MSGIFGDLYSLEDPVANRPFRATVDCTLEDAASFSRGERVPSGPVDIGWGMGSGSPSDVVWTLLGLPLIVSSRVVDLLVAAGFTGWDTYAVRLTAKNGQEITGFHGLAITGRCDAPDLARSELTLRRYPGGWFPVLRGCYFTEASYDGSDLFMERPDERGHRNLNRYITGRAVRLLRQSRIGNLRLEKLSEIEIRGFIYESGLRYRLPKDYDERVAALHAKRRSAGAAADGGPSGAT